MKHEEWLSNQAGKSYWDYLSVEDSCESKK